MSRTEDNPQCSLSRALVLSLAALVVPVFGVFVMPDAYADYEALLWLVALIPAFLLACYRGWRGVATALAAGMAVLSITYAIAQSLGRSVPQLLFAVVIAYIAISLLIGWLAERLKHDRISAPPAVGRGAFTDSLTGLPNGSHADLHLDLEFNAAQRGRSLTVVYFDLDRLKLFNTGHGRAAGDDALRTLSGLLTQNTRRLNLSARYGTDEFISILGGSDENGAIIFVSRILNAWRQAGEARELPSMSIGIAAYNPSMRTPAELVAGAAEAARRAKREGDGRVRVHGRAAAVTFDDALAVAEGDRSKGDVRTAGRKALVVVEEPDARSLLANYLNEQGFSVTHVSNVVDGVQCLSTEYDVVLTDVSLIEGTGAELVRAARTRWPSVQTIGLISAEHGKVSLEALNAGFDRYLEKPIDLSVLRHYLADLLARRDRLVTTVLESRQLSLEMGAQRTEAVNALKRTEAEYRSVVETLHAVIFRICETGEWLFLNAAWTELTNHPIEDSVGQSAADFVHADDRAAFAARHRMLIDGEIEEMRDQIRLLGRDGSVVWVELRARRISNPVDGLIATTGTLTDITRTKAAEEKLRQREAASRAMLEALPDEVFGLSWNGVFLNFDGVQTDNASIVGRSLEQVFDSTVAGRYREAIARLVQTRDVQVIEYTIATRDGVEEHEARLALIGADEIVVIVRNISDRRRLEEQLRQSQKLEAIGRLAGGIAHDFNNLLTVVQGNTHFLMEEMGDNDSARECIEHISRAAQRGADLIRQLLAFSRRQVLQPRVLHLNEVITSVQPMLARLLGEDIIIEAQVAPDLGLVRADPGQIEQVIVSLATFSKTRLPAGGNLRLTARNVEDNGKGPLAGHRAAVALEVADDGPRLDEKTRERIFEPFFGTIKAGHTHGIGLASVYGIVTQSGGAILLDDAAAGDGICFRILLPRVDQLAGSAEQKLEH